MKGKEKRPQFELRGWKSKKERKKRGKEKLEGNYRGWEKRKKGSRGKKLCWGAGSTLISTLPQHKLLLNPTFQLTQSREESVFLGCNPLLIAVPLKVRSGNTVIPLATGRYKFLKWDNGESQALQRRTKAVQPETIFPELVHIYLYFLQ